MGRIKDINIENITCYFYDDMVNIKDFDSNLLKIYKTLRFITLDISQKKINIKLIMQIPFI